MALSRSELLLLMSSKERNRNSLKTMIMLKEATLSLLVVVLLLIAHYGRGVSNYNAFTVLLYTFGGILLLSISYCIYKLQRYGKVQTKLSEV